MLVRNKPLKCRIIDCKYLKIIYVNCGNCGNYYNWLCSWFFFSEVLWREGLFKVFKVIKSSRWWDFRVVLSFSQLTHTIWELRLFNRFAWFAFRRPKTFVCVYSQDIQNFPDAQKYRRLNFYQTQSTVEKWRYLKNWWRFFKKNAANYFSSQDPRR